MSAISSIEWTDRTWNPTTGCAKVSPGCARCYAVHDARRMSGNPNPKISAAYDGLTTRHKNGQLDWTGVLKTHDDRLLQPLSWRKPQRIFVNSMSDLFHAGVPHAFIDKVFAVMALAPQHTFQILTKRPERMLDYFKSFNSAPATDRAFNACAWAVEQAGYSDERLAAIESIPKGLPNVWLGVSCEDQPCADERIPLLLQTPATVRFISAEPLLGPLDLVRGGWSLLEPLRPPPGNKGGHERGLDWVIVGGESGPQARRNDIAWSRSIVDQCHAAGVPVFVKQLGAAAIVTGDERENWPIRDSIQDGVRSIGLRDKKGGDLAEWPVDLRVREFPEARA